MMLKRHYNGLFDFLNSFGETSNVVPVSCQWQRINQIWCNTQLILCQLQNLDIHSCSISKESRFSQLISYIIWRFCNWYYQLQLYYCSTNCSCNYVVPTGTPLCRYQAKAIALCLHRQETCLCLMWQTTPCCLLIYITQFIGRQQIQHPLIQLKNCS